jgi:hypothetical protein
MPYNPGVYDRSGSLLAQGIMSAGQSIGQGIRDSKQMKEDAKRARTIAVALGMDPGEAEAAGLGDLQGFVDSRVMLRAQELQDAKLQQGQAEAQRSEAEWRRQMMNEGAATRAMNPPVGLRPEIAEMGAAQRYGAMGGTDPSMIRALMAMEQSGQAGSDWAAQPPQELPGMPGYFGVWTSPNSRQVVKMMDKGEKLPAYGETIDGPGGEKLIFRGRINSQGMPIFDELGQGDWLSNMIRARMEGETAPPAEVRPPAPARLDPDSFFEGM